MFGNLRADLLRQCAGDTSLAKRIRVVRTSYAFRAVFVYRFGRWVESNLRHPLLLPARCILLAIHTCLRRMMAGLYGIDISRRAVIGKGLYVGHFGGIVVGPCRLGENCSIHQHVRIGADAVDASECPEIGSRVWIGAHARLSGSIAVADGSTISTGAVVTSDVGPRCLIVGDPARVISTNYDNTSLL